MARKPRSKEQIRLARQNFQNSGFMMDVGDAQGWKEDEHEQHAQRIAKIVAREIRKLLRVGVPKRKTKKSKRK